MCGDGFQTIYYSMKLLTNFKNPRWLWPWKRLQEPACDPEISYRKPQDIYIHADFFSCIQWGVDVA